MQDEWFIPWEGCKMPPLHTESYIRRDTKMPTEEELEQLITERLDKEKAVENIENVSGLSKGNSGKQAD